VGSWKKKYGKVQKVNLPPFAGGESLSAATNRVTTARKVGNLAKVRQHSLEGEWRGRAWRERLS